MRLIAPVLCAIAVTLPAYAAGPSYSVRGPGAAPCVTYTALANSGQGVADPYFFWAEGFMSAINMTMIAAKQPTQDLSAWSPDEEKKFYARFCSDHPSAMFMEAVGALFKQLPQRKL